MERAYLECDPKSAPQYIVSRQSDNDVPYIFITDSNKYYDLAINESTRGQGTEAYSTTAPPTDSQPPRPTSSGRKKWVWISGLIVFIVVVVAATVGGVIGSQNAKKAELKSTSTSAGSEGSSTTQTASSSTSTNFNTPGSGSSSSSTVNDAWAYNGTNIMAFTFSTTSDTTGTNYVVFHQHSNGDIRQVVYNNSQWHDSQFVTNDARPGSPISAWWKGDDFEYGLFYVDKNNVLQELRGKHASNSWLNGTLGQLSVVTSDPSHLSAVFVGDCKGASTAWIVYNTAAGDETGILYWDGSTDTWSHGGLLSGVKPGAGFSGHANIGVWRYYYVANSSSQLQEQVCPDCCSNATSAGWRSELNGPVVRSEDGGIFVANVGLPRMIYYLDNDGAIRELNNSHQYPDEVYMAAVSSHADAGNTGTAVDGNATVGPTGMVVAQGIPNGKVSMAPGFRGKIQQIWLFYQATGHDITVQIRDADAAGNWTDPTTIPVGIS